MLLPTALSSSGGSAREGMSAGPHQAYMLCYNTSIITSMNGELNSGWVFDNRGGPVNTAVSASLTDVSTEYGTAFIREFNRVGEGRIMLETSVAVTGDGAYLAFRDDGDKTVWQVGTVDGNWAIMTSDGPVPLTGAGYSTVTFRVYVDLDRMVSETYINGKYYGEHPLLSDNVLSFRFATDEKSTATLTPGAVHIEANYSVCEVFDVVGIIEDDGWTVTGDCRNAGNELYLYGNASAEKDFEPITGKVCTEAYMLTADDGDTSLVLSDGNTPVLTVASVHGTLTANGTELYKLNGKVYNRLRIEMDLETGVADILLNGRSVGTVGVSSDKVDSLTVKNTGTVARLDNVYVYNLIDVDDYVPEPEAKASDDDYIVGINVCSLWCNGSHIGWACNTAYDDIEPVLGYYDEGNPETADWEIKFLAEHGVDFQAFCWYCDNANGPVKCPFSGLRNQIHDGYMYAKYSDFMNYCLIWEAQSGVCFDSKQFREYVIPYWFENYFLDSRYMKIENRPVLSVFSVYNLISRHFGSAEAVREELDYLEEVAKSYGFDGMLYLACNDPASAEIADMGFDGVYAYNWGKGGSSLDNTIEYITKYQYGLLETVPCISVGFNNVGWSGERSPLMPLKYYDKAHKWVTEEYLPEYMSETWSEKFVMISSWNEYGEGTYLMPAEGLNGFGYLDVLRKYYTNLPESHTDVIPTEAQKERINHLYPQYARQLKRQMNNVANNNRYPDGVKDLYINGILVGNTIKPAVANGVTLYPFDECARVSCKLGAFTTWRKLDGTLKIEAEGHTVQFGVGSDVMLADGKEIKLKNAVTLTDGVPMIDFAALSEAMGWTCTVTDGNMYVTTGQKKMFDEIANRREGMWEFNAYDTEGWTSYHMALIMTGETMKAVSISEHADPIIRNSKEFSIEAEKYSEIEIRCRYSFAGSSNVTQLFFLTDKDQSWNEAKSVVMRLDTPSTGEGWVTLRASLRDVAAWKDTITYLRFDPFNSYGEMEIDYIRLIRDPATVVYGDVNTDGKINVSDATALLNHLANWGNWVDLAAADCNGDGKINVSDVTTLLKYLANWEGIVLGPKA